MNRPRAAALSIATAGLLAVGASGVALAPSASAETPAPTRTATHHRPLARALLRQVLAHGGAVGHVTSVTSSSLVVTGAKGVAHTYDVTSATHIRVLHGLRHPHRGSISDVTIGERVLVRAGVTQGATQDAGTSATPATRDATAVWVLLPPGATPSATPSTPAQGS